MRYNIIWISALVIIFFGFLPLQAIPITSQGDLSPFDTVIDFEDLQRSFTSNPLTLSGATFSSASSMQIALNIGSASITYPTYVSGNFLMSPFYGAASLPITITFSQPVLEIGLGIYDPNVSGNSIRVFNSSGDLLESVESDFGPAGGSFSDFIGVTRQSYEIAYAEIVPALGDYIGIDNITFSSISFSDPTAPDDPDNPDPNEPQPAPVPEPATITLLGLGLFGFIFSRKK